MYAFSFLLSSLWVAACCSVGQEEGGRRGGGREGGREGGRKGGREGGRGGGGRVGEKRTRYVKPRCDVIG